MILFLKMPPVILRSLSWQGFKDAPLNVSRHLIRKYDLSPFPKWERFVTFFVVCIVRMRFMFANLNLNPPTANRKPPSIIRWTFQLPPKATLWREGPEALCSSSLFPRKRIFLAGGLEMSKPPPETDIPVPTALLRAKNAFLPPPPLCQLKTKSSAQFGNQKTGEREGKNIKTRGKCQKQKNKKKGKSFIATTKKSGRDLQIGSSFTSGFLRNPPKPAPKESTRKFRVEGRGRWGDIWKGSPQQGRRAKREPLICFFLFH